MASESFSLVGATACSPCGLALKSTNMIGSPSDYERRSHEQDFQSFQPSRYLPPFLSFILCRADQFDKIQRPSAFLVTSTTYGFNSEGLRVKAMVVFFCWISAIGASVLLRPFQATLFNRLTDNCSRAKSDA